MIFYAAAWCSFIAIIAFDVLVPSVGSQRRRWLKDSPLANEY
jgi:hypothetical protein